MVAVIIPVRLARRVLQLLGERMLEFSRLGHTAVDPTSFQLGLNSRLQVYFRERGCPLSVLGSLRVLRSQSAVRRTAQERRKDQAARAIVPDPCDVTGAARRSSH